MSQPQPSSNVARSQETCPAELPNFCAQRHWSIFWILILCSLGTVGSRIVTLNHFTGRNDTPFYSANDRSRWATIRALGDHGTYEIDEVISADETIRWDTIDKVRHVNADGEMHFYSSKPPLLPTALAGVYRMVRQATGWTLAEDTHAVVRLMLLIFNGGGWFLFLYFFAQAINAVPVRDWARYYALGCAGFGTFLSTFSVTLNNHLPAAIAVMIALYFLATIWRKAEAPWWMYAVCGLFSALAVTNELPALAFAGLAGLLCLIKSPTRTLLAFAPASLLIAAAFLITNYQAHDTWSLAYSHRHDGDVFATVEGDFKNVLEAGRLPAEIHAAVGEMMQLDAPQVENDGWPSTPENVQRWVVRDLLGSQQYAITLRGGTQEYQMRHWNNWYDYPGSYWSTVNEENKSEVDRGESSIPRYAFHVFFGHHGIFSLTPIWLLAFAGMLALAGGVKMAGRFQMRWLGWMGLILTVLVIAFYLRRPAMDRNYGGVTSGLRWVFWLAPIWLLSMLPVIDWLGGSRWGKLICYGLLLASIFSVSYSASNPWVQPWLYEVWDITGMPR